MRANRIISLVLLALFVIGCAQQSPQSASGETTVRLGIRNAPADTLAWVAYEKGYFKEEGLDVQVSEFTAGVYALQALLAGSIDVATPAEVPPTLALLQGNTNRFVIVAQGVESTIDEVRVVARRDGTLETPEEYFKSKKRKLATSLGGGPEFFTYNFLKKNNISGDEVELIGQKPEDLPAALASGSVDAVATFEPFAYFAEKKTKDAITFRDTKLYSEIFTVVFNKDFIEKNAPDTTRKFLRALKKAERFTQEHPEEAKQIVVARTKIDKETLDAIWETFEFRVVLTPQLVEYMRAEERWAKETGKVPEDATLPPLQEVIDIEPLKSISPESVRITW
jgi:NitT/TauT family transport system substrate-binding protein